MGGGRSVPVIFGERSISIIPPLSHVPRCGPIGLRGEEGKGGKGSREGQEEA